MKLHKSIKIESELIKAIERKAKSENRSFNNMVEVVLVEYFKEDKPIGVIQKVMLINHTQKDRDAKVNSAIDDMRNFGGNIDRIINNSDNESAIIYYIKSPL